MLFTFRLARIECDGVLSTADSEWGAADGVRVFFLVTSTTGARELLISGRELPPPDAVENYRMVPGKSLDLRQFPPVGALDWETSPVDVGPGGQSALVTVIGLNEGVAHVGGGGGPAAGKAAYTAIEEYGNQLYEAVMEQAPKAAAATGQYWLAVGLALLEELVDKLNDTEDCRGVAFAYEAEFALSTLLSSHLTARRATTRLNASNASRGLHIVAAAGRPAGCGTPKYELDLEVVRQHSIGLRVAEALAVPRQGPPRGFEARWSHCAPAEEMSVWTEYFDRSFTIRPTVPHYQDFYPTWHVDGVPVPAAGGTVTLTKQVHVADDPSPQTRQVSVDCRPELVGDTQLLHVETRGLDGNHVLRVSLRYKFIGSGPWVDFHATDVFVDGQQLAGNDAYRRYLECTEAFIGKVTGYKAQRAVLDPRPGPWPRLEQVLAIESHLNEVARALRQ